MIVAAGNQNTDACQRSPACSMEAITVGAYAWNHKRAKYSNYGDCIDAWAPGHLLMSSLFDGSYDMKFGTSMVCTVRAHTSLSSLFLFQEHSNSQSTAY